MPKSEMFNREEVMNKIMVQFWKHGYHGTSMQDIVNVSGLNRSSIYNSFGDKFNLYLESLKQYRNTLVAPSMGELKKLDPRKALRLFFGDVIRSIEDNTSDRGCLITNCTTELVNQNKEIDAYVADSVEATKDFFRQLILIGIENGDFDQDIEVEKTVLYLYSSLLGLRVTAMQIPSKEALEPIIDNILKNI